MKNNLLTKNNTTPNRIPLLLKCLVVMLTLGVLTTSSYGQNVKVDINSRGKTLEQILPEITHQTGVKFSYDKDILKTIVKTNRINITGTIEQMLDQALGGTGIKYRIADQLIYLSRDADTAQADNPESQKTAPKTISGTVISDVDGEPIIGATVVIEGTSTGVTTDIYGKFHLNSIPPTAKNIVVNYIGMKSSIVPIAVKMNIRLGTSNQQIDEVVVTGFQNISKASFTGAATKLMADDIKVKGVIDASRMLEGQVAGVTIQNVSSTFGAAPKVRIRGVTSISGENKPLWVIDGVVHEDIVNVSNEDLTSGDPTTLLGSAVAGLNANDIESIDVLKDASAISLYGARAMNGVVVVTTKRGKAGDKPVIRYSGNFSIQLKPRYTNYDIMNSDEQMSAYAELDRKGYLNDGILNWANWGVYGKMYQKIHTYDEDAGKFLLENTTEAKESFLRRYATANTNWFDILFRNSLVQEHSVSISSGSEKSRLYGSMSFMDDQGWSMGDGVQRYTANLRQDVNIGERFNIGYQVVGSVRKQHAPGSISRRSNTVEGSYDRDFDINPFSYALNTSRALTAYDEGGNLEYYQRNYAPFNIIDELRHNRIELNVIDFKMQAEASYKITKYLKWELLGAYRYVKSDREHKIKEQANMANAYRAAGNSTIRSRNKFLYKDPDNPGGEAIVVLPYGGIYNRSEDFLTSIDVRNSLTFTHSFGKHNLNVLAGHQIKSANRQKFSNTGYGYQYDKGGTVHLDYKILKQMVESNFAYYDMNYTYDRFASFYAKVDYDFDLRYVFTANVRYDGSNGLGKSREARWLPTWGISGRWNLGEEPYMKDVTWLTYASVRASYGLTASIPPSANATAIFENKATDRYGTQAIESVIRLKSLANNELTWEKAYSTNLGIDVAVFDRRVDLTVDFWWRNSFDLISDFRVSGIGGDISKKANYADMRSHGIDLGINLVPIKLRDFRWNMGLNMGYSKNKIVNSKTKPRIYDLVMADGGNLEGYPVRSLFSIKYKHLDENGVPVFINESGKESSKVYMQSTDVGYLVYEGPTEPKYTGGFSNSFTYKGLSLSVFLTFAIGNKIRLAPSFKSGYSDLDAMSNTFYNRWLTPEDGANIPAIFDNYEKTKYSSMYPYNNYNYSTQRLAKGDFVRVKTISLSYKLPQKLLQKTGFINGATFSVAGSNLFMLYQDKKLNGQDPEFFNTGGVAQPLQKQIIFSLSMSF